MHQVVEEPCDHDWEFCDDSFSHEFGTEIIYYWICPHCGVTRPANSSDDYDEV